MKKKLLIVDSLHPDAEAILHRHQKKIEWKIVPHSKVKPEIRDAHFLITRSTCKVDRDLFKRAKNLRLVVMAGAGLDGIDLEAAQSSGVLVTNTREANSTSAAELSIGLILCSFRSILPGSLSVKSGDWKKRGSAKIRELYRGNELYEKTLGVIGLGRVGKRVAERLQAFGMKVLAYDPYLKKENAKPFPLVSLADVLREADILSFHVPLTAETREMISRTQLNRMKKRPLIVNTSRGAIVNERDILIALKKGLISGYAADVFDQEPLPKSHPFLRHPKILVTPHLGAQTHEAHRNVSVIAVQQIMDFLMTGDTSHALKSMKGLS